MTDFSQAAANWDEQPGRIQLADALFAAIEREIGLKPSMDAFEFGCGTGLISLRLASKVRSVLAADTSKGMLAVLRRKIESGGYANAQSLLLEDNESPLPAACCDLLVCSLVLHHIEDVQKQLARFASTLRMGGQLALIDLETEDGRFHPDPAGIFHNGFDRRQLQNQLQAAGFSNCRFSCATEMVRDAETAHPRLYPIFLLTAVRDNPPCRPS